MVSITTGISAPLVALHPTHFCEEGVQPVAQESKGSVTTPLPRRAEGQSPHRCPGEQRVSHHTVAQESRGSVTTPLPRRAEGQSHTVAQESRGSVTTPWVPVQAPYICPMISPADIGACKSTLFHT